MKDSQFIELIIDSLGPPEHWCKGVLFEVELNDLSSEMRQFLSVDGVFQHDLAMAEYPEVFSSVCLEWAMEMALYRRNVLRPGMLAAEMRGYSPAQTGRVRKQLRGIFREQFPDLYAEILAEAEAESLRLARKHAFMVHVTAFADPHVSAATTLHWSMNYHEVTDADAQIPSYNDHEAMTYEGVRSVLDKALVQAQERGQ